MKAYVVEKTEDSVTLGFRDADLTFITPLMKMLDQDSCVDLVRYIDVHPELEDRKIYVKVNSGSALEAVDRASKAIAEYYSVKE